MRNGQQVGEIPLHEKGHVFPDGTHESPHYHGKGGSHISYEKGNPRNTNQYKGRRGGGCQ